jgi:hypothetical protein
MKDCQPLQVTCILAQVLAFIVALIHFKYIYHFLNIGTKPIPTKNPILSNGALILATSFGFVLS